VGTPIGRAIAFFFGLFAFFGGVENRWWIDIRPLPEELLAIPGVLLLFHAVYPLLCHRLVRAGVHLLIAVALLNTARYYTLDLPDKGPLPFSLVVAALLMLVLAAPRPRRPRLAAAATISLLVAGLPLAHILFFGKTNYARHADVIVVFGARCYTDGRLSQALEDRVRTGCALYRAGYSKKLLFSGGPGDGATHETEAMRRFARTLGVPDHAIELDREGHNTRATIENTGPGTILAVSHYWHLPRIKSTYRRGGRTVFTVPARESYTLSRTPYLIARESAAFWWYLLT